MNSVGDVKNKNILFLQGPMGNFFKKMDSYFQKKGASCYKIGFNFGDFIFSNKNNYTPYRDKKENWGDFIYDFLSSKNIDKVFLFGDCRFYQNITIKIAQKMDIDVFVFEEGYVRPDYVTLERWGVNNFSLIPKDYKFYKNLDLITIKEPTHTKQSYIKMAKDAALYYIFAYFGSFMYPYYEHHRKLNPYKEAFYALRNVFRKYLYKITEKGKLKSILEKKYYFVPLQTYNDFQIKTHSNFDTIEEFIEITINSFANHAPRDTYLVLKHHPMDRGRRDYKHYINTLANTLGIGSRIIIIYDMHLPTLLQNTLGTVTINSTVGLQALYHNSPVKVLGNAIYDIKYLTNQTSLDDFWLGYMAPDRELFKKFKNYLIKNTQVNGSFYGYFNFNDL